ncbi:TPA: hypothetical protein ACPSKY_002470 [Legionella bozemanae]
MSVYTIKLVSKREIAEDTIAFIFEKPDGFNFKQPNLESSLFYSNHRPEDAAFLDELKFLETDNSHYHFIPTMTNISKSREAWQGETGYINKKMLSNFIKDLTKPIYYISGPATRVPATHHILNEAGIDDDMIRMEEFSGY